MHSMYFVLTLTDAFARFLFLRFLSGGPGDSSKDFSLVDLRSIFVITELFSTLIYLEIDELQLCYVLL